MLTERLASIYEVQHYFQFNAQLYKNMYNIAQDISLTVLALCTISSCQFRLT